MTLIFVEGWLWSDPPSDPTADYTIRCEHGRPVDGNPCQACPCPTHLPRRGIRLKHRIGRRYSAGHRVFQCDYCDGVYGGTPYPKLPSSRAAIQLNVTPMVKALHKLAASMRKAKR